MQSAFAAVPATARHAIRKTIIHLAWPVIAEQLLSTLANMVDTVLVGRLGAVFVAAAGLTQLPHWLMLGLFMGLGVGVNALVARFQGAGELEQIESATRAGFWLGLSVSTVACALLYAYAPAILRVLGAEPDVAPIGAMLLRLLVPGMVAIFWMMVMTAALRATGDTRTSMLINLGINLLNGVLAYSLIYGHFGAPALGIRGAGIATSTARILGATVLLVVLLRRKSGARIDWRKLLHINWDLLRRILRVGSVSSSERMFSTLIFIGYARMVATLGTVAFAAHTITISAENVSWMLSSGFSMATAAMVGQRLGARRVDEAEAVIREATVLSVSLLSLLGLMFILLPGPYLAIFTRDRSVQLLGASALRIAGFTEACTAWVLTLNGALSGAGDTRPLFFVSMGGGVVRLSLAALLIFGLGLGLQGAWLAAGADWVIRSVLIWLRYRSGAWKSVTV
ncbi:MAG TPA: MATE family efflux transporter [Symbiobacteriaceae bacterium]